MVTLHDIRFVECRWWTVKTVITGWLLAPMIPAHGLADLAGHPGVSTKLLWTLHLTVCCSDCGASCLVCLCCSVAAALSACASIWLGIFYVCVWMVPLLTLSLSFFFSFCCFMLVHTHMYTHILSHMFSFSLSLIHASVVSNINYIHTHSCAHAHTRMHACRHTCTRMHMHIQSH